MKRFIFLSLVLTFFIYIICINLSFMQESFGANKFDSKQYIEYEVFAGDTYWDICSAYMDFDSEKDIRKFIYKVIEINGIEPEDLKAGQIIKIPTKDR